MTFETYGRWPWIAAAMAAPAWAMAIRRPTLRADGAWVAGLALPILLTHQTEEWVVPGGFLPFCNEQLLGSDRPDWPLTERDGFHVNVSLGWSTAIAGALLWRRTPALAAGVVVMEVANVGMHLGMAARQRRYNPGVGTAALLMVPHAVIGAREITRSGRFTRRGGLITAATGITFASVPAAMKARIHRAAA